jgi:hypothetical protein
MTNELKIKELEELKVKGGDHKCGSSCGTFVL